MLGLQRNTQMTRPVRQTHHGTVQERRGHTLKLGEQICITFDGSANDCIVQDDEVMLEQGVCIVNSMSLPAFCDGTGMSVWVSCTSQLQCDLNRSLCCRSNEIVVVVTWAIFVWIW